MDIAPMKPDETQSIKRLRQQIQELQQRWDLLSQQITQLEQQRIVETRIEEKIRLKKTIVDAEAERNQVEQHLKSLENRLRMDTGRGRFFIPIEPTLPPDKPKLTFASKEKPTGNNYLAINFLKKYRILAIALFGIILVVPFLFYSRPTIQQPKPGPNLNPPNKARFVTIVTTISGSKVPSQIWQIIHNEKKYKDTTPYRFQGEPGKQIDYELRFNNNNRRLTLTMPKDENLECVYQMDDSWRFQQPANQNPYCPGAAEVRGVPTD
jgi:hypothetical protein